jgi:hypothetical protein
MTPDCRKTPAPGGQAARIKYLDRLTDDELVTLIDFHGQHFLEWCDTRENPRLSLIYHGQILWALLDECERRGKTVSQLSGDYNRRVEIARAWAQRPGNV